MKPVPTRGMWRRGAAKVVGGLREGMAAAGGVERSLGGQMARNEATRRRDALPEALRLANREALILRPGATRAQDTTSHNRS